MKTRKYELKTRARKQEATRARIVRAAMELHEELGPAWTTVSAIAERAGVQRLTVYRHFPDDEAIFRACTSLWADLNPPPDPAAWMELPPGETRARTAFLVLARYYRKTAGMLSVSYRDLDSVPALAEPMARFEAYFTAVAGGLAEGAADPQRRLSAVTRHAVSFGAWSALSGNGLDDEAIADVLTAWWRALSAGSSRGEAAAAGRARSTPARRRTPRGGASGSRTPR